MKFYHHQNKDANPAAVPNYPEPASSARDDVLAPSANSLPPSPAGGKPTNLQEGIAAARANAQAKKQAEASAKAQPPQAKFSEKFTVFIPFLGDIPYRSSQPFSAGNAEVVSSRVITTNTKITKNDANVLGLEPKPMVYAWRVSVVKHANGEFSSVIEAMNYDTGRTPDGEVVAYFKPVENQEAVNRIAPAIAKAALKDWQAQQGSVGLLLDAAMEPEATKSGPFGPIFEGFENNPEGAIAKLMQEKRGEVTDAFTHPELGKIGFVYGDNNMGLLHIANKRGMEWVNRIPEILKTGELVKDEGGLPRTYLVRRADTPPSVAVIRLDWDGKGKTWLVTAYPDDFGKFTKSKNPDNNQKHTGRVVDGASGFSGQSGQFDSATKSKTKQEVEDGSLDTARYTGKVDNPILDTQVARVAIANNYSDFKTWYDGYVAKRNAEVEQKTNRLEQLEDFLRAHSSEMRSVRPFAPKASASQAVQDAFAEWRPLNSESMNGLLYPIPPDRNPLQVWTNYRKRAQAEGIAVSSNGVDSAAVAEQNAAEAAPDYLPAGWKKSGAFYEFRNASGSEFTPSQVAEVLGGKARRAGAYWMTDVPYHQWEQAKAKLQAAGMWSDSQQPKAAAPTKSLARSLAEKQVGERFELSQDDKEVRLIDSMVSTKEAYITQDGQELHIAEVVANENLKKASTEAIQSAMQGRPASSARVKRLQAELDSRGVGQPTGTKEAIAKIRTEKKEQAQQAEAPKAAPPASPTEDAGKDAASDAPKFSRTGGTETETQRQFKETERAYGGRAAYDRAKAAGKTKLTYGQWVQVRTPNFKAWFGDWEAAKANEAFNAVLKQVENGSIKSGTIIQLGTAGSVLNQFGIAPLKIEMTQSMLSQHMKKHGISFDHLRDLAAHVQSPVAVFKSKHSADSVILLTEIQHPDGDLVVALQANKERNRLVINDIRSIHPKPLQKINFWIEDGLLIGVDKERGSHLLSTTNQSNSGRGEPQEASDVILFSTEALRNTSKVVDPNTGEPMVVYHGTNADFDTFRIGEGMYGTGVYLAKLPEYSSVFADSYGGNVMPVFANIRGSMDGNILPEKRGGIFVAFSPEQVKSATGNNGDFDGANPDIRRSFAGQQAATADTRALASAQQRLDAGEDAEMVRQDTGWHKGKDGKWRFEISDADARPTDKFYDLLGGTSRYANSYGYTLGNVLNHPALFSAYPELRSYRVYADDMQGGRGGEIDLDGRRITIDNTVPVGMAFSILLHEIQHGIQTIEGFASGGSPDANGGFSKYNRLAGEVEARNTQTRQKLTDAQRRTTPPSQTADVADSDVIVVFNGTEMANAPMPANAAPSAAPQPARTPTATIRTAITQAYGKLLGQLESKGLVTLAQTEAQAIEAAAQARADKTGGDVVQIKQSLLASVNKSLSPMKSVDANIRRGLESLVKALDERTTVHRAMYRNGLGWVDFVWGDVGKVKPSGKTKGAMGISHIFEARQRKDGLTDTEVRALLGGIVNAIASGTETRRNEVSYSTSVTVQKDGIEAILTKSKGSNTWLVSGWNQINPADSGAGSVASTTTVQTPTTAQRQKVSGFADIVRSGGLDVKLSANGAVQGFFDQQTGQSFLIADNLTAEAAPGVLMHEVGIHMAADGSMKALFNRAALMLKAQKADPFMQAVQAKLDAAGETSAEEVAAYLVEAYENQRAQAPASVKRWLQDLLAAVKAWLHKKGIVGADSLTVADIAAVARANAKSMAREGVEGSDIRFSRAPQWQASQDRAEPTPATWQSPETGRWDEAAYNIQDHHIDTKRVQQAIEASNGQLADDLNVRQREELFYRRSAKEMQDFKTQELNPMLEQLGKDGIELAAFHPNTFCYVERLPSTLRCYAISQSNAGVCVCHPRFNRCPCSSSAPNPFSPWPPMRPRPKPPTG